MKLTYSSITKVFAWELPCWGSICSEDDCLWWFSAVGGRVAVVCGKVSKADWNDWFSLFHSQLFFVSWQEWFDFPSSSATGELRLCCTWPKSSLRSLQRNQMQRYTKDLPPHDEIEVPRTGSVSGSRTCRRSHRWSNLWRQTTFITLSSLRLEMYSVAITRHISVTIKALGVTSVSSGPCFHDNHNRDASWRPYSYLPIPPLSYHEYPWWQLFKM